MSWPRLVNQCTVAFPVQVWFAQRSGPIADCDKSRLEQDVKDPPTPRVVRVLILCVSQLSNSFVQRALNDAFVRHENRGLCLVAFCAS